MMCLKLKMFDISTCAAEEGGDFNLTIIQKKKKNAHTSKHFKKFFEEFTKIKIIFFFGYV